jgi:hypothetical protein
MTRDSDTRRMAETGTGSVRSTSSAGRQASPNTGLAIQSEPTEATVHHIYEWFQSDAGGRKYYSKVAIRDVLNADFATRTDSQSTDAVERYLVKLRAVIHPLTQQGEDRIWRAAEKGCALIDKIEAALTPSQSNGEA